MQNVQQVFFARAKNGNLNPDGFRFSTRVSTCFTARLICVGTTRVGPSDFFKSLVNMAAILLPMLMATVRFGQK